MLVSLLAIMKAGHALCADGPDPSRTAAGAQTFDLVRMGAWFATARKQPALHPPILPVIRLDEDAKAIASMTKAPLRGLPTDTKAPAYIILTSGSTRLPKGSRFRTRH